MTAIHVDRGDMVKADDIVAEIGSAETDNQLASAMQDLENKRRNAKRAHDLVHSGAVSVQPIEQAETNFRMAEANVAQLGTLKSYEQIEAPFDGRITARFVEVGALVHMRPVTVASTDGMRAMLAEGAKLGDKIAVNLPNEVSDGGRIQPVASG